MDRDYTLIIDTREKKPLIFPANLRVLSPNASPHLCKTNLLRVHTKKEKLDTGDYLLRGYETVTMIERKGSLREVATNCLNQRDRKRFVACLERMKDACAEPILLLEGTPLESLRKTKHVLEPGAAIDALMRLLTEYGIKLLLLPTASSAQRRATGEWAARLLINGAINGNPL
jgi:ERCC4-type nuclease